MSDNHKALLILRGAKIFGEGCSNTLRSSEHPENCTPCSSAFVKVVSGILDGSITSLPEIAPFGLTR